MHFTLCKRLRSTWMLMLIRALYLIYVKNYVCAHTSDINDDLQRNRDVSMQSVTKWK